LTEDYSILTRTAGPADQTLAYGQHADQVADVRLGQRGKQWPLVALIHGGFWKPAYDRHHTEAMAVALAKAGWTVLTLEYRRIPGDPDAMVHDIQTALTTLPSQVTQHNGQLLLIGHSAGGHLALWAAAALSLPALRGVVALAPAADLRLAHGLQLGSGAVQGFLGSHPDQKPALDPMNLAAPVVPVTVIQGEGDQIVPMAVSQSYCRAFPKTRLRALPEVGHFALIDPQTSAWNAVVNELQNLST
jgi:acetyl esterase/lipase